LFRHFFGDSFGEQVNGGEIEPGFAAFREKFVVFGQATEAREPSQGAFDDPTLGQHLKAGLALVALDNLQVHVRFVPDKVVQMVSIITAVREDGLKGRRLVQPILQYDLGALGVLQVRPVHHRVQQTPQGIHQDVPLAPHHFFSPHRSRAVRPLQWF